MVITQTVSAHGAIDVRPFLTSLNYNPSTDKWTVIITTNVQSPYVLTYDSFGSLDVPLTARLVGSAPAGSTPVVGDCAASG